MKKRENRQGTVLVHTGDGKGKSSSGFGMVFRSAGWGMKVLVVQFIKGKWKTGEKKAADQFENIEWHVMGDGFTWDTNNPEQDIATARHTWEFAKERIKSAEYDVVMLDEINYASSYGWITGEEIAVFIKHEKPAYLHLIMTGRDAQSEVIEVADTVTEMKMLKHAYSNGIMAQQGVEF